MSRLAVSLLSYLLMAEGALCLALYVLVACPLRGAARVAQAWSRSHCARVDALARAANYPSRSPKP